MSEEIESSTEKLEEQMHEAAEHAKESWLRWCALLAALFAVMAALSGLIASGYANKAMLEQIRASDQWSYYQAKSIKRMIVESQNNVLKQVQPKSEAATSDSDKTERYRQDEENIQSKAESLTQVSERHMEQHEITARAVTCFQVSIALIAIVVLTKRRRFLLLSVALGIAGFAFLIWGVV